MSIEIVTYHSTNAKLENAWIAHVVLPNGEYWGVRFCGSSEEIVKVKATQLWASESQKYRATDVGIVKTDNRGLHFAGKAWMINKTLNKKIRIDIDKVDEYTAMGWERGGPRSNIGG